MTAAVTPQHVTDRVADWEKRLDDLFEMIETAATVFPAVNANRTPIPPRQEDLMKQFSIAPPDLFKLVLNGPRGTIELVPKALWVIGANGRLDLLVNGQASILVDTSRPGSSPQWELYDSRTRRGGVPFDAKLAGRLIQDIA